MTAASGKKKIRARRAPKGKRTRAGARSKAGPSRDSYDALISTVLAGVQTFAKHISRESRDYITHELSKKISHALNSDTAKELKSLLTYWRSGSGADEFGKDPSFVEFLRPLFQFMYYNYFRVDVAGIRHIPRKGPAILVANHAGTLPYDGAMVHLAVYNELAGQREVRFLVDDFVYDMPLLGTFIERIGGMRACQENAQDLLDAGHLIVVFPEGVAGIGKPYEERYRLRNLGKGGFVRLAMRTGVPVIPVAIVGSEETHPIIWKSERLGSHLGLPFIPFTPTFPWLGPLGMVPLPSKWKIMFSRPHRFDRFKPSDADKKRLVDAHANDIRDEIQDMLDEALSKRANVWV